jgi:hypothetical protein
LRILILVHEVFLPSPGNTPHSGFLPWFVSAFVVDGDKFSKCVPTAAQQMKQRTRKEEVENKQKEKEAERKYEHGSMSREAWKYVLGP